MCKDKFQLMQSEMNILLDNYKNYIQGELGLSDKTAENYLRQLKPFFCFLNNKDVPVESFSADIFREYLKFIHETKHLKSRSVLLLLSSVKSFVHYQQTEHIRKDDPLLLIESPKVEQRFPKRMTESIVRKIIDEPDIDNLIELRDKAMMYLLYASGLRSFELVKLSFENINFPEEVVRIHGKGGKDRIVPVANEALQVVEEYVAMAKASGISFSSGFLFPSQKKSGCITRQTLFYAIKKYAKRAGIPEAMIPSAHTFRHTFASHLLDHGADLRTVQILLGHENLATTEIYTHVATKRIKNIYKKVFPRS